MTEPKPLFVRDACRRRIGLDGTDAQALEHALTMTERERDAARAERDAERALVAAILDAGRELASLVERDIASCGNSPPHPADCDVCRPERKALNRWARANWRLHRARGDV